MDSFGHYKEPEEESYGHIYAAYMKKEALKDAEKAKLKEEEDKLNKVQEES